MFCRSARSVECINLYLHDPSAGTFKQPLFAADGSTCNGVETVDGTRYYADKVVLAAGAWTPTLVDLEDQCVSKVSAGIWLLPSPKGVASIPLLTEQRLRPGF